MLPGLFEQGYLEGFKQCYMDSRNIDKYVVWLILMFNIQLTSQWINDNLDSSVKLSLHAHIPKILHFLSLLGISRHYQSERKVVVIDLNTLSFTVTKGDCSYPPSRCIVSVVSRV